MRKAFAGILMTGCALLVAGRVQAAEEARAVPVAPGKLAVRRIDPPESGFYSKRLDYQGIPIKGHEVVSDEAFFEAWRRLDHLLANQPGVVANLKLSGAELHIIGRDQVTSDLPEYRHMKGRPFGGPGETVDTRTRGFGGIHASCGEENLLKLREDRYRGGDIMSHEFAHTILNYGLSQDLREKVIAQYRRSLEQGLWRPGYASSNYNEYFAELTMWYVGTRGCLGGMRPPYPGPGPEGLKKYDPEGFALLDEIYSGRSPATAVQLAELTPLPPEQAKNMKSPESEEEAEIIFRNTTDRNLKIVWIGHEGEHSQEGRIPARGRTDRKTYLQQAFLITDDSDQPLQVFVTRERVNLAMVGSLPTP